MTDSLSGQLPVTRVSVDGDLLIEADVLLSLIRYRESSRLSEQTIRDLDALLPRLRHRTDQIASDRRHRSSYVPPGDEAAMIRLLRDDPVLRAIWKYGYDEGYSEGDTAGFNAALGGL